VLLLEFTSPSVGAQNIAISMSSCLSVCLSVCPLVFPKNHLSEFHQIFVHVIGGSGLLLLCQQCNTLCTFSVVDDVMFSHNGANGPELKMLRMFR